MSNIIDLETAIGCDKAVFIDVRSPIEYQEGCIPGAINIPLFTDEERSTVGTTYKQVGSEEAKQEGLKLVSPKLPSMVNQIQNLSNNGKTVVVYCWRGGMRSKSIVNVLDVMGIRAHQLTGGYKAYRRYVLDRLASFVLQPIVVVLCGSTGVGKTTTLDSLEAMKIPVLNLEKLANHRGSAFGHVGLGAPTTAQRFDTILLAQLEALNNQPYFVVECESKRVGNVYLPGVLYEAMQKGPKILLQADIETRITRLIEEYTGIYQQNQQAIESSIETLRNRLGQKKTDALLADLRFGNLRNVVRTLLSGYYDGLYGYEIAKPDRFAAVIDATVIDQAVTEIIEFLHRVRR